MMTPTTVEGVVPVTRTRHSLRGALRLIFKRCGARWGDQALFLRARRLVQNDGLRQEKDMPSFTELGEAGRPCHPIGIFCECLF